MGDLRGVLRSVLTVPYPQSCQEAHMDVGCKGLVRMAG